MTVHDDGGAEFGAFIEDLTTRGLYEFIRDVAARHHVTMFEMFKARDPHVIVARMEFVAHLRGEKWSFPSIGKLLRRDHSTIMNYEDDFRAVKRLKYMVKRDAIKAEAARALAAKMARENASAKKKR